MSIKIRRYTRSPHLLYQTSLARHLVSIGIAVAVIFVVVTLLLHFAHSENSFDVHRISVREVLAATGNTFFRMLIAYVISLVVAVPIALLIASSPGAQRVLLPIADILQSVPVLAFFPVIVAFFTTYHAFEAAAIFVIFAQMVWNIVFPVIGGLQTIPDDVRSAAIVFNCRGWKKFWYITLPAIVPFIITGSLLAWAQGWTIVIVAEVLHTYIPHGDPSQDLLGLGSLLVDSTAEGQNSVFLAALAAMILIIALINLIIWQPLLRFSQRFRFD